MGPSSTSSTAISNPVDITSESGPQSQSGGFLWPCAGDSAIAIFVYGGGGQNLNIGMRVILWSQVKDLTDPSVAHWCAMERWRGYATTGLRTGVSGGAFGAGDYVADTYTAIYDGAISGLSTPTIGIVGQDGMVGLVVDCFGRTMIEVRGGLNAADIGGGTPAASFGVLFQPLSLQ